MTEGKYQGFIESISHDGVMGWISCFNDHATIELKVIIDDVFSGFMYANRSRPDVVNAQLGVSSSKSGFIYLIDPVFKDGRPHRLSFQDSDGDLVELHYLEAGKRASIWEFEIPRYVVLGRTEPSAGGSVIHGWSLIEDRMTGKRAGGALIRVLHESGYEHFLRATLERSDVGMSLNADPYCGFLLATDTHPQFAVGGQIHFYVMPGEIELIGSPVSITDKRSGELAALTQPNIENKSSTVTIRRSIQDNADAPKAIDIARFELDVFHRRSRRTLESEDAVVSVIHSSFDYAFYDANNSDVASSDVNPLDHFVYTGWREGRKPTPWFDTIGYLENNPDVAAVGVNPFWHYLVSGKIEGRSPTRAEKYKREMLDCLVSPEMKTLSYEKIRKDPTISASEIMRVLRSGSDSITDVVMSISHDCYITSNGGIQIFLSDEQTAFNSRGIKYLHVSPLNPDLVLSNTNLDPLLNLVVDGIYHGVTTFEMIADGIRSLGADACRVTKVLVHSLLGNRPESIEDFIEIVRAQQVLFWLHDFSALCEGFNLLRNDIEFCFAPSSDSAACTVCIYGKRRRTHIERVSRFLNRVRPIIVAPSKSAFDIWSGCSEMRHLSAVIHPHCHFETKSVVSTQVPRSQRGTSERPLRIAYVGRPSFHKGWPIYRDIVERAGHFPCYQFSYVSSEPQSNLPATLTHISARTSADDRNGMIKAIKENRIDVVVFPAIWPETFSYVTYEAICGGAYIVALRSSGNPTSVIDTTGQGMVVEDRERLVELFESLEIIGIFEAYEMSRELVEIDLVFDGTSATLEVSKSSA